MPTVRQKWTKLVQQPMLTCWQASISWPVAGSANDPARPPSRCRDSSTVTRNPRGASAAAAASPASPPPTTSTEGAPGLGVQFTRVPVIPPPSRRPRRQQDQELSPPRDAHPGGEHVEAALYDLVEQGLVEPAHHPEHRAAVGRQVRIEVLGPTVIEGRRPSLFQHHFAEGVLPGRVAPAFRGTVKLLPLLLRQVDPAAGEVLAEVAEDVRELKGVARVPRRLLGLLPRRPGPQPPHPDARQADDRRDTETVLEKLLAGGEPDRFEVGLDAVGHREQVLRRDVVAADGVVQGGVD